MRIWAARSYDKSRIRLQQRPFDPILWAQWSLRDGDISEELWYALGTETDEVEIERLHQELWRSLESPAT